MCRFVDAISIQLLVNYCLCWLIIPTHLGPPKLATDEVWLAYEANKNARRAKRTYMYFFGLFYVRRWQPSLKQPHKTKNQTNHKVVLSRNLRQRISDVQTKILHTLPHLVFNFNKSLAFHSWLWKLTILAFLYAKNDLTIFTLPSKF